MNAICDYCTAEGCSIRNHATKIKLGCCLKKGWNRPEACSDTLPYVSCEMCINTTFNPSKTALNVHTHARCHINRNGGNKQVLGLRICLDYERYNGVWSQRI